MGGYYVIIFVSVKFINGWDNNLYLYDKTSSIVIQLISNLIQSGPKSANQLQVVSLDLLERFLLKTFQF